MKITYGDPLKLYFNYPLPPLNLITGARRPLLKLISTYFEGSQFFFSYSEGFSGAQGVPGHVLITANRGDFFWPKIIFIKLRGLLIEGGDYMLSETLYEFRL